MCVCVCACVCVCSKFSVEDCKVKYTGNVDWLLPSDYRNCNNKYVVYVSGRIGNQMEHFLGGLAFAKQINRTLVLPPFRTYVSRIFIKIQFNHERSSQHFSLEGLTFFSLRAVLSTPHLPGLRNGW